MTHCRGKPGGVRLRDHPYAPICSDAPYMSKHPHASVCPLCSKVSTVVSPVKLYGKFKSMELLPGSSNCHAGRGSSDIKYQQLSNLDLWPLVWMSASLTKV